jgi:tRNA(fMet)-specific endonuclease VapC
MMPERERQLLILDTNVLLAFIRAGNLGQRIEEQFQLRSSPFRPLLSVISVGEIHALARRFNWGQSKIDVMATLLDELVWVSIDAEEVIDAYSDVYLACEPVGKKIGQNDMWIAATARATGATLLTTDKDFDHLGETLINRIWIDQAA